MIKGNIKLPGDKSISHRAALFAALKEGTSVFTNFNLNDDCSATLACLKMFGIDYKLEGTELTIFGKNIKNWQKPSAVLNAQNSGTTARLLSGILASLPFETTLMGDPSLSKRPMDRVVLPLRSMGAKIETNEGCLPLTFKGESSLNCITYKTPMASAQVKSAILLAGLFANGQTKVIENSITRDHTERMLDLQCETKGDIKETVSSSDDKIPVLSMEIPGDFSSAAFFICAALVIPNSNLQISNVSLNPTRIGLMKILKEMGAKVEHQLVKIKPEPIGSVNVQSSQLKNLEIPAEIIPNIIDEIPILAVLATQAKGRFVIRNAKELRFKESDRINSIVQNLREIGIQIEEFEDGFSFSGPQKLKAGKIITHGDHRIAMAFSIANLLTKENILIDNPSCAAISFPGFFKIQDKIQN